ncbi:MAG: hypothetical protein PHF86_06675 [Candidatus Nanoarchaeia archaeon]|jgi:hypothetical protein|nr:hypothetical protein [Candidatus Nanoarchaeia archaeon]
MLVKLWRLINGRKRTIALIYWSVLIPSIAVIWPNGCPDGFPLVFSKSVTIFGFLLSALGLGHAAVKSKSRKSIKEETNEETSPENSK